MKKTLSLLLIFSLVAQPVLAKEDVAPGVARRLQRLSLKKLAVFGLGSRKQPTEESAAATAAAMPSDINPEEAQAGTPDTLATAEVSPELIEIIPQGPLTATQPWQKPNFAGQSGALGYSDKTFVVPPGLKDRVAFWRDIYSKYTTNQGVMHDSLHIDIVFRPVDFNHITRDLSLNPRQKHHARERLVNGYRKEIEDRLKRLANVSSPEGLQGEDLRVWKLYEKIKDADKFNAATKRGRIRFQLGQKDRFALGIYYSGRYLREMEKIFKNEGLPIELTRLPLSKVLLISTHDRELVLLGFGSSCGEPRAPYMMVNNAVDERNDPIKATRSAAKLLKSNYMMLKSWPLALTGYNHGPSGIARIVKKTGTTDLTEIINTYSSRRFGFASENFYACFLAALEVERNAQKYFGGMKWSVPLDHAEIKLQKPVPFDAVKVWFKDDAELAQLFNPHFSPSVRKGRANMPKGTNVRVPPAMRVVAEKYLAGNIKLSDMRDEAKKSYKKIPIMPEGTPVATISAAASPEPTLTPIPAATPEPAAAAPEPAAAAPEATATPEIEPTPAARDDEEVLEEMPADLGATPGQN